MHLEQAKGVRVGQCRSRSPSPAHQTKKKKQVDEDGDEGEDAGGSTTAPKDGIHTNTTMPKEYKVNPVPAGSIKIVSYNVASINAALKKGFSVFSHVLLLSERSRRRLTSPQRTQTLSVCKRPSTGAMPCR